jgi:hypothetical protein
VDAGVHCVSAGPLKVKERYSVSTEYILEYSVSTEHSFDFSVSTVPSAVSGT